MNEATAIVRAVPKQQVTGWEPTPEQEKMVRDMFLSGASQLEAQVLMEVAKARRLNPITRQIHFVKRWDGQKKAEVWSSQVGIDGFRVLAERTGIYAGQDEPEYVHDKTGNLMLCKVRVYRKDWGDRPAVGVAYYSEYVQKNKEGQPNAMWARGPHFMLAKCAEAIALRKAFPDDCGGLYEPAELGGDEVEINPAPRRSQPAPVAQRTERKAPMVIDVPAGKTEEEAEAMAAETPSPSGTDAPREPGSDDGGERYDPEIPYGQSKGKRVSEADDRTLSWLADALHKAIDDKAKLKWRASNQRMLAAVLAEVAKREGQTEAAG